MTGTVPFRERTKEAISRAAPYLIIVVLGTAVRIVWAGHVAPWWSSVDNLVWTTVLNASSPGIRLDELIHYPHQPGTLLYSLAALALPPQLGDWPALNVVSLWVETGMRLGLILCAHWVFGRRVALLFALWTIMATPLMLEWSVIPHGMHANAALWPLLGLALIRAGDHIDAVAVGALCAASLFWSLDNAPLVLWAFGYTVWIAQDRGPTIVRYTATFALALIPLVLLRVYGDLGFDLQQAGPTWIRGIDLSLGSTVGNVPNVIAVWLHAVPGSSLMPGVGLRVAWVSLV